MHHSHTSCESGTCDQMDQINQPRRRVIQIAAAGLVGQLGWLPATSLAAVLGAHLVEDDTEGEAKPLRVSDLRTGKPVLAYPFDTAKKVALNESRLNKIVLIRLPEAEMSAETRALSAGGVLAYSAVCTHQGCDVKTWLPKEKALVCYCHASKFALLDKGNVVAGPATRALPAIPLALDGDHLVIAGAFTATPGASSA